MFSVLPVENKIGDCCCWYGEFGLSPMKKNQSNVPTDIFFGIRMGYGIHPVFTNELTHFWYYSLRMLLETATTSTEHSSCLEPNKTWKTWVHTYAIHIFSSRIIS